MKAGVLGIALCAVLICHVVCGFRGPLEDVSCTAEEINSSNKELYGVLKQLTSRSKFFSFFKVNLYKDCPFWPDDGMCLNKDSCGVECCRADEIPVAWRADGESGCVDCIIDPKVDKTIQSEEDISFSTTDEDVWIIQDHENEMEYVDLNRNPESYTGYRGDSARRAWTAIYDENCFSFAKNCVGGVCLEKACKEERVLFRLISGIHTSITMSIVKEWLYKDGKLNLEMYKQRVGSFPDRLRNLYFLLALMTRAVAKGAPVLSQFNYQTGDHANDAETKQLLGQLWSHPSFQPGCLKTFDESDMFQEDKSMERDFQTAFRNISAIMDCVGCEKCKLWGKVQFLGLGTALKLLFEEIPNLQRNEIIALFQTFHKISSSVSLVEELESLTAAEDAKSTAELAAEKIEETMEGTKAAENVQKAKNTASEQATDIRNRLSLLLDTYLPRRARPFIVAALLGGVTSVVALLMLATSNTTKKSFRVEKAASNGASQRRRAQ
mmetsp:Transcript_9585/g.28977  ORF Transcript_9585/g.28977 Transcript_9585/m.28977 type:complete len:495 (+) Transcript_9585:63-1547(+)